ncbi:MAG: transcriptional regulator, LacI family, partial [Humibacillus sp.]|nr:transcriptional regulator, LacI family [Humibacillus sp.]
VPATALDVARLAGVSTATVSRVLNGARKVTPDSDRVVREAAAALDYRPNEVGRALRKQATRVIGMVVPRVDNPFFPSVVQAAEERLRSMHYALLLCTSEDDPEFEAETVEMLISRQVEGLLVSPCSTDVSGPTIDAAARRVPLVQIDRSVREPRWDYVGVDDDAGIRDVVRHVVERGARRIAYVGGSLDSWSGQTRADAFAAAARELGLDEVSVHHGSFDETWGNRAGDELLRSDRRPDAIVTANDLIALGVLQAARRAGVDVPSQLLVTGYDDIRFARLSVPPLTTVRQPLEDLTHEAIDLLMARIEDRQRPLTRRFLPVELVSRESTAAPARV